MTKAMVSSRTRADRLLPSGGRRRRWPLAVIPDPASAQPGQQPHEPAAAVAEQLGQEEIAGGALADLAEGGVGRDHAGNGADLQTLLHRQGPEMDHLASARRDDIGAQDAPARGG